MDKDLLDQELTNVIANFKYKSLSNSASMNAPIDKSNLVKLQKETAKALEKFKDLIIKHLSE